MDFSKTINGSILDKIGYKITIRTGEITVDNGDGTYDVKIANADSAYPNVETLNSNETYGVNEIVIIGFEYGCKESPKILGHDKKIAQEPKIVEVDYSGGARVKTLNAYSITAATAYLNGEISITANIIGNCTRRGFHYGTDTDYGSPDEYEDGSFEAGTYTLQIEELDANTTYHYQAFVLDANGDEQVGEDKTMTTATAPLRYYALIVTSPNTLQSFDTGGNFLKSIVVAGWSYAACDITVDSNGNIYTETAYNTLKKYDSDFNLLVTHYRESESNWFESLNMGPDGFLYTLEGLAVGYAIKKRRLTDLHIVSTIPIFGTPIGGLCLDSNGNFYCFGSGDDVYKYSSAGGASIASKDVGSVSGEYAGCGVLGNYVYFTKDSNEIIYLPLDLSSYTIWGMPSSICYAICVADNHLICTGWDGDNDGATSKYDSSRNLIWTKKLDPITSYAYKAGGYNF